MKTTRRHLIRTPHALVAVALLAGAAPAIAQDAGYELRVPAIVTVGEAVVRRAPNRVYITASVESRARDPREAQRKNAEGMASVLRALDDADIPDDDVRTLGYSIQQEVDYVDGRRVLRDYLASNAVEVRLDDVERAGEVLGALVQAGATSVSGLRFDLRDRAAAEREAVRLAVSNARARAEAMADGAGETLGDILRIEDSVQGPMPPRPMAMSRMSPQAAEAVDVPVAAGEIEIHAQVTLTIAIR